MVSKIEHIFKNRSRGRGWCLECCSLLQGAPLAERLSEEIKTAGRPNDSKVASKDFSFVDLGCIRLGILFRLAESELLLVDRLVHLEGNDRMERVATKSNE